MPSLQEKDLEELKDALPYMNMGELKETCTRFHLPSQGQKGPLIHRILTFLHKGEIAKTPPLPEISKAKKNVLYPLAPHTLILSGNYKNDEATRNFMKTLVGNHFHFTAFGQDWIKARWREGRPPTYNEFASYWKKEYEERKAKKSTPKKEWAYLNFIQRFGKENPESPSQAGVKAWKNYRKLQVEKAKKILDRISL